LSHSLSSVAGFFALCFPITILMHRPSSSLDFKYLNRLSNYETAAMLEELFSLDRFSLSISAIRKASSSA